MSITGSNITFIGINFINGKTDGYGGGAIYFNYGSNNKWTDCNFINNIAGFGGAIYFNQGSNNKWTDCNFTNNTAELSVGGSSGGAICFELGSCNNNSWVNCNFTNNTAAGNAAAICMQSTDSKSNDNNAWTDCNFINCKSERYGGAILISWSTNTTLTGCNFKNNIAPYCGAIYLGACEHASIMYCNFTNNTAKSQGGALYISNRDSIPSYVSYCNFIKNSKTNDWYGGGAVKSEHTHFMYCNFTNNTANECSGAINGNNNNYTFCNFINNSAPAGSVIGDDGLNRISFNACTFINNTGDYSVIYSEEEIRNMIINYCIFDNNNVPYCILTSELMNSNFDNNFWGTNNTITPEQFKELSLINYWEGNFYPESFIVVNINGNNKVYFASNDTKEDVTSKMPKYIAKLTTEDNSQNITVGDYILKDKGYVNVTSLNSGKLLAEYTLDSFTALNDLITNNLNEPVITLPHNYHYYNDIDQAFELGVPITKDNLVIDGNGTTISGSNLARIFYIPASNITFKNINFVNGSADGYGGAIFFDTGSSNNSWTGCNFTNNTAQYGAIYFHSGSNNKWTDCNFIKNNADDDGGAIYFNSGSNNKWTDCNFTNNTAKGDDGGGAIRLSAGSNNTWTGCNFINNTAMTNGGGAIRSYGSNNTWTDCNFINNNAKKQGGAIYNYGSNNTWTDCNFINNTAKTAATSAGGAIYTQGLNNTWTYCNFINNTGKASAGAIVSQDGYVNISYCIFDNNNANKYKSIYVPNENSTLNNNFWGTNNTITADEFKNLGLINNFVPGNFIVLNINGNKVYFASNDTKEDVTSKMPKYIAKLNTEDSSEIITVGESIETDKGYVNVTSLNSGKLLAEYAFDSFTALNDFITNHLNEPVITLPHNYHFYNESFDQAFKLGVHITKDNLVIDGNGSTISGSNLARIFNITASNLTFKNINFINGNPDSNSGGAIYSTGSNNKWTDCNFTGNNVTKGYGGAIYCSGSSNNTWTGCNFINNTARSFGGAIYFDSGSSNNTWTGCNFIKNNAQSSGAAISSNGVTDSNYKMTYCTFINNTASREAGVIMLSGNNVHISYCIFDNNIVSRGGPNIYGKLEDSTFNNNFWGTNNTITPNQFKELYLITDSGGIYLPENFIVLNINQTANGYKLYFASNGTDEDITGKMPDYISKVKFNDTITEIKGMGTHNYPTTLKGEISIKDYSLNSGLLLAETTTIIKVNVSDKVNITIPVNITYGDNLTVNVTCDNVSGTVDILINGSVVKTVNVTKGTNLINIPDLGAGKYNITAVFSNPVYYNVTNSRNVTVNRRNLTDKINITVPDKFEHGDNKTINVDLGNENATGEITLTLKDENNNNYTVKGNLTNGKVNITIPKDLPLGNYTIGIDYNSTNGNFSSLKNITASDNLIVVPKNLTDDITITVPDKFEHGDNKTINVDLGNENATGEITLTLKDENNNNYTVKGNLTNGKVNITIPKDLPLGNYTVGIDYNSTNGNFSSLKNITASDKLNVNPKNLTDNITITVPENIKYGDNKTINVDLGNENATGEITLTLKDENNNNYTVKGNLTNGKVNITIPNNLPVGNYTIGIDYNSTNGNFSSLKNITASDKLNVNPKNLTDNITITVPEDFKYGDNKTINVDLGNENATGEITLTLKDENNNNYTVKGNLTNGKVNITIPNNLPVGNYTVGIDYNSTNGNFSSLKNITASDKLNVNPKNLTDDITITVPDKFEHGDNKTINVDLGNENATGEITLTLKDENNNNYTVKGNLTNGKVNITIPKDLPLGNYTVGIDYNSTNGNFSSLKNITASDKLNVNPKNLTDNITITVPENIKYGDNKTINVDLGNENATGEITLTLKDENNNNYTVKGNLTNGKVNITIPNNLPVGNYTIGIDYNSTNGNFSSLKNITASDKLNVNPKNLTDNITITVPEDFKYGDNKTINVDLGNENATGEITLTLKDENNNNYTVKGNLTNGKVNITIPNNLPVGNYTVGIDYNSTNGNFSSLKNITASDKLNVNPKNLTDDITITVPDKFEHGDNKTINVDLGNENATGEITLTLKDENNNNYTVKGNLTNGKVNITIPKDLPLGNYTVGIDYNSTNGNFSSLKNITASDKLNVNPKNLTDNITITVPENIKYGDNKTINVDLGNENATGEITLTLKDENNNNYTVKGNLTNGKVNITIPNNLPVGNYTIGIDYNSTNGNFSSLKNITADNLIVTPKNLTDDITITVPDKFEHGDNKTINVDLGNENATGEITLTLKDENNNNYTVKGNLTNGKVNITIPNNLPVGNYTIGIDYNSTNGNFSSLKNITASDKLNVNPKNLTDKINITVPDKFEHDDNKTIDVDLGNENATGEITLTLKDENNNNYTVKGNLTNGKVNITIPNNLPVGNYTIGIDYNSTNGNFSSLKNITADNLIVTPKNLTDKINITVPENIKYGDNKTIDIDLGNENATGEITLTLKDENNNNYTVKGNLTNGKVNITIPNNLPVGNYTIGIDYNSTNGNFSSLKNITADNLIVTPKNLTDKINITVPENIKYGDNKTIDIDLGNENATGEITLTLKDENNNNYTVKGNLTNGKVNITIPNNLPVGNYTIGIDYNSTNGNFSSLKNITADNLIVTPKNLTDKINITVPENIKYGDNKNITVDLGNENATGEITLTLKDENNNNYTVKGNLTNGKVNITIPKDLPLGNYTVGIDYNSTNGNFSSLKNITADNLIVAPKNLTDNINITVPDDFVYGDNKNITVDLGNENATGEITLTLKDENNNNYTVKGNLTNGKVNITMPNNLPVGNYDVILDYNSTNGNFSSLNDVPVSTLTVLPIDISDKVNITIPTSIMEGENLVVNVSCDNITGVVTLIVDGAVYDTVNVVNGTNLINIPNLTKGNHKINAEFFMDNNHTTVKSEANVNVKSRSGPTPTPVSLDLTVDGDDLIVTVNPSNAKGNVNVVVGNETFEGTIEKGRVVFKDTGLVPGDYSAIVTYEGDSSHKSVTKNINFTVPKLESDVIIPSVISQGEDLIINIIPADATGTVSVTVDGETYTANVIDGKVVLPIPDLDIGNHDIVVSYSGDDIYKPVNVSTTIAVKENIKDDIIIIVDEPKEGENNTIIINVPDDVTGNVTVVVDGENYTGTIINGTVVVITPPLAPGNHNGIVIYTGDNKYGPVSKEFNFTIKQGITFKGDNVTKFFGGAEKYVVKLFDGDKPLAGEIINITINGKSYTRKTDENGTVNMSINLNTGNYTITATWNSRTIENTVIVKSTIHADNFIKYYLNGTQYEAYVLDSQGNPLDGVDITFNIHGVFYTRTCHNGIVRLNINLLPDKYIITAYNDVTGEASSANVTVLPTLVGNNMNMTYLDGSVYECKLIDGQGTPVQGAMLTFNIHGVFYNKTTDENGIARLNINLFPGEYIITAIYDELTMTSNIINVRD